MQSYCCLFKTTYNIDSWIILKPISYGLQLRITKTMSFNIIVGMQIHIIRGQSGDSLSLKTITLTFRIGLTIEPSNLIAHKTP